MKMPALALLIAFSAVIVSGQPNQRSNANQPPATGKDPSAITLVCNDCAQTHISEASANPPKWYTPLKRPEVWLVVVGFITCGLIWWQAKKTAEAAKATRDSVRLQEKAMAQWIDVTWRTDDITKLDKLENADGTPTKRMRIRADIVNKTNFPLTLTKGEITIISNFDGMVVPYIYSLPRDYFLTPQLPYVVDIRIEVSDGQYRALLEGLLPLGVEGAFSHSGVLDRLTTQPMKGMLVCGIGGARFESELPMHPRETQPEGQNPN
jgi:hypothetical protein